MESKARGSTVGESPETTMAEETQQPSEQQQQPAPEQAAPATPESAAAAGQGVPAPEAAAPEAAPAPAAPPRSHDRGPHGGGRGGGRGGQRGGGRGGQRGGNRDRDRDESGVESSVVRIYRCSKVVKGGRTFSFGALVVAGDRKGNIGIGYGKANEVPNAVEKGTKDARKQMFKVNLKGGTVPHQVTGKSGASSVVLDPAR